MRYGSLQSIMIAQALSPRMRSAKSVAFAAWAIRRLPVVLAVGLFLALALHQLHLPGLYYDEALDLVPMLAVMRGEQPELLRNIGLGRFPVMLLDYMGSLGGYLSLPFMWIFGPGYVAARLQPIFFSCITLVLAWLLARRWFGFGVAAVAVLLLAVNPSFIWFSRQGISVTSVMTVFSLSSLLLLDEVVRRESQESRNARRAHIETWLLAFAAGLMIGLGLWAKFLFLRWVVVLLVIGGVFLLTRSRKARRAQSQAAYLAALAPALLIVLAGLLVGAFPLIYYNLVGLLRDGQAWTLTLLVNSLTQPTQQFGVDNRDVITNLRKSIEDVRVFVDGSYFWYNGIPFSNVFAVPTLVGATLVGGALAIRGRSRCACDGRAPAADPMCGAQQARRFLAVVASIGALIVLGAFTVSGLWATHQFIMLPLPQLVVACAAVWLAEATARRVLPHALQRCPWRHHQAPSAVFTGGMVCLLLALPFSRDLWVNEQHHATLARTGGSGRFSDAVYKLADWLEANDIREPVALDWGIAKNVQVLTGDRVRPIEIFGFSAQADDAFRRRAEAMLRDPDRRYIVLWERFAVYNRRQDFTEIAHRMGRQVVETFIAHERSGLPVYVVLQAR